MMTRPILYHGIIGTVFQDPIEIVGRRADHQDQDLIYICRLLGLKTLEAPHPTPKGWSCKAERIER